MPRKCKEKECIKRPSFDKNWKILILIDHINNKMEET